jgi:hypothetical protein
MMSLLVLWRYGRNALKACVERGSSRNQYRRLAAMALVNYHRDAVIGIVAAQDDIDFTGLITDFIKP